MDIPLLIREKALRHAVRTGDAADLDFIWGVQRSEGRNLCFGSFCGNCPHECKWYYKCREISNEKLDAAWPIIGPGLFLETHRSIAAGCAGSRLLPAPPDPLPVDEGE